MSESQPASRPQDSRVQAALQDYLERVDRGELIDRAAFVAEHPEIADELRTFIETSENLEQFADESEATSSVAQRDAETLVPRKVQGESGATDSGQLPSQFGRYRVLKPLGSGAMGTVYLAEDTQLERKVALKTPSFEKDEAGELLERFYREARSAATLRHSNICPVHDVGEIDGRHYISMAYIEGRPLSAYIRPDNLQSERQILLIIRKLALALQEAHEHGIVHRDLKPGNIMIDPKGEPIIMDFGLARRLQQKEGEARLTQSGMLVGSPAYMSPEQVEGEPDRIGPASDQYSLGVILYEMLTGQLPFRGSITAVIGQILTKQATPPGELRPGLDPRIATVCGKMMAKQEEQRFHSTKEIADEVARILKGGMAKTSPAKLPAAVETAVSKERTFPTSTNAAPVSITASNVSSLFEAAQKCMRKRDFEQVVQMLETIPEHKQDEEVVRLLTKARQLSDEVQFLLAEIDEALRTNNNEELGKKADELLKLKPGHHKAKQIKEELSRYGGGLFFRRGQRTVDGRRVGEGSWIPWMVIAFGVLVFGVSLWGITIYLRTGSAVVRVEINDPNIRLSVQGESISIDDNGQEIRLDPQEGNILEIAYGDTTFRTEDTFDLMKGDNPAVSVTIVNEKLLAEFGEALLGEWPVTLIPVAAPTTEEWTHLFNGRDLTGWLKYSDGSPADGWTVEDGQLHLPAGNTGNIMTTGTYGDFELEFDWKISTGGNSGVIYRARTGDLQPYHSGPEYQILDDDGHDIGAKPLTSAGAIYNIAGPQEKVLNPAGQWNMARIVARGDRLEHWLNGARVAVAEIGSSTWNSAVATTRFRSFPQFGNEESGHIVLQDHGDEAWFRNIRIRDLNAPTTAADDWTDLFNGRDLTGWRGLSGYWRWENDELVGRTSENGIRFNTALCSERTYGDFAVQFEVRLEGDDPNSGLQIRSQITDPDNYIVAGPQVDMGGDFWGSLYGERSGGMMKQATEEDVERAIRPDDWNLYVVTCVGQRVTISINGVTTVDEEFAEMSDDGILGWQLHARRAMTARFRNIQIRELKAK